MSAAITWPRTATWWMAVCATAGLAVGLLLELSLRQRIFLAVLAVGACGLFAVWRGGSRDRARAAAPSARDIVERRENSEARSWRLADEETLLPDAAREWLDQFLRRQQG